MIIDGLPLSYVVLKRVIFWWEVCYLVEKCFLKKSVHGFRVIASVSELDF